jgi:hypothetical protein
LNKEEKLTVATLSQVGIGGVGGPILMPKLQNRWNVQFVGIGGTAVGNDLSLQATTVTFPNLSFEEIQLDRYNSRAWIAGKHNWDPCTLTIEDDITNRAQAVIQAQLETQQRLIGASGPWLNSEATASGYKFGAMINTLDGNEGVVETWKLEGCYISAVDYGSGDYSTAEKRQIQLTLRYDHARQELLGGVSGTAIGGLIL